MSDTQDGTQKTVSEPSVIYNHPIHQRKYGNPPTEVFDAKAFAKDEDFAKREAELLRGICPFCLFNEPLLNLPKGLWECQNCLRIFYVTQAPDTCCGDLILSEDKTLWTCDKCGKKWPMLVTPISTSAGISSQREPDSQPEKG